jgi:metal-dependent hydrolase (beta-lactamase superfamily II)/zinc transporter ZupT
VNRAYTAIILLSFLSIITTCLGVALALKLRENAMAIAAGIGFSAGIMILISILELIPESIAAMGIGATVGSACTGAILIWVANLVIPHLHLVEENTIADKAIIRSVYLVVFGLILHDVPEGFAMANAYVASPALGLLVALAIALHNLPEEFAMAVPAVMLKSRRFLFGAALLSALAEPLGAVIGLMAVGIAPALNAHFLAFAAGAMIFISIHELIPMARRYRHVGLFVCGVLLSALVYWLLADITAGQAAPRLKEERLSSVRESLGPCNRAHNQDAFRFPAEEARALPAMPRNVQFTRCGIWLALVFTIISSWAAAAMSAEPQAKGGPVRITVVYNNVPHAPGLAAAWGLAAVIETGGGRVLFDTGGNGPILLANLQRLGIDPASIDAVVLSHIHGDHTGGLDDFLGRHSNVTVYMPRSFPAPFRRMVEQRGARVETVSGPRRLFANLHSTGEMGEGIQEQALIINTDQGLVVVTGCAHPGIVEIATAVRGYLNKEIYLLMGGFHLLGLSESKLRGTVQALRGLGIHKAAPSHCTGDAAIALFRENWKSDFIEGGCGAIIEIP